MYDFPARKCQRTKKIYDAKAKIEQEKENKLPAHIKINSI